MKDDWLPKDERKLLAFYFRDLSEACFRKKYTNNSMGVVKANRNLSQRHLIDLQEYKDMSGVFFTGEWAERDLAEFLLDRKDTGGSYTTAVELTLSGWDLGRKYNNFFDRIGLWCTAKEHQWLWVIIIFVAGYLAKWLFDLFFTIIKNNN